MAFKSKENTPNKSPIKNDPTVKDGAAKSYNFSFSDTAPLKKDPKKTQFEPTSSCPISQRKKMAGAS